MMSSGEQIKKLVTLLNPLTVSMQYMTEDRLNLIMVVQEHEESLSCQTVHKRKVLQDELNLPLNTYLDDPEKDHKGWRQDHEELQSDKLRQHREHSQHSKANYDEAASTNGVPYDQIGNFDDFGCLSWFWFSEWRIALIVVHVSRLYNISTSAQDDKKVRSSCRPNIYII